MGYKNIEEKEIIKFSNIKGIIYDLDGTVVDSAKLHRIAWKQAGKLLGADITEHFLINEKGMPNEVAAKLVFPNSDKDAIKLAEVKNSQYVLMLEDVKPFEDFSGVFDSLKKQKIDVWICTATAKSLTDKVYANNISLENFSNKTVGKEMYSKGKPDAEPILTTLNKMKLSASEVVYVGDGLNDYLAACNAGCRFIYFCRDDADLDKRIPPSVLRIRYHNEILSLIS